jgi:transcriptional regulator with XRE-family HTH domain
MNIPVRETAIEQSEAGEKIKKLLAEQHSSITALAEYTGLSRPTLYRIIEGRSELKLKDAIAVCRFLGISLEKLYDIDPKSPGAITSASAHFGLSQFDETALLQKIYKNLARKELAKILREAAEMLEKSES